MDLQDRHGNEPLWTAVFNSRGYGELITLLLAHGAELARLIANYPAAQFFPGEGS